MHILVADDDPGTRRVLEAHLRAFGHDVDATEDGQAAWDRIQVQSFDAVVLDWMMPRMDGLELCRRIRESTDRPFCYILMLTSRSTTEDLVLGIDAGADDFMTKPFDADELRARLHAAGRVIDLERSLARKIQDLEQALREVKTLRGLIPICMYCHSIRDDRDIWERVEEYIAQHSDAEFTHSICPSCYDDRVKPMLREFKRDVAAQDARERDADSDDSSRKAG